MRLQLIILRHGLPVTRILWTVRSQTSHPLSTSGVVSTRLPNAAYGNEGCTIAQLLEDINEVVPLETPVEALGENEDTGGQWGLEDYVVEVNGFECLHFMSVDGLLREGDEVVIRALGVGDIRARRLSGRLQVSTDGRRLIDGVPFGRPYLQRSYSSRPPIRIPPRKRRRTSLSTWAGNTDDDAHPDTGLALYDNASLMNSEHGTVIRHPRTLFEDGDDDEDNDMDYEVDTEELAEELKSLRDETEADVPFFETPDFKRFRAGRTSRMAHRDPLPSSSPARPSVVTTPRTNLTKAADGEASAKSTKSVHFETYISNSESQLSESDSESDEDVVSHSSSAASSDTDDSSLETSDEDFAAEESDVDSDKSSVSDESELESEDDEPAQKKKSKVIDVFTPPGQGNRKTRNSNRRKKLRARLAKLKSLGELPPEANFDDLKKWQAKNGKAPLTEVTDLEGMREPRSKEQSEIEIKRQQLLRDLASGGVDVDGHSEKENIPPRYKSGKQRDVQKSPEKIKDSPATTVTLEGAMETPTDELVKASPTEATRRKLDLSSTKRLLFGSLGVRTPKTKEDEAALRTKLDATRTKHVAPEKLAEAETAEVETEKEIDENWQDKIVLSATECFYDDIELTAPPFPFQQRWDSDANYAIRQRKNNNSKKNKKRKQRDWQEEENYEDNTLNDNDAGDITLNYDEPPVLTQEETTTQKQDQEINANGDVDDLPELPSDVALLPVMTDKDVTVGSIIAFKQLLMSKATNWQPQISDYKVARIIKIYDNGTFEMILANRDREVSEQKVDEDGVRRYSGFEMPDDDNEAEDDGLRSVTLPDLLEPKIVKAAAVNESDQSQQGRNEETLANGNGETSLFNRPPSVPGIFAAGNAASVDGDDGRKENESDELPPLLAAPSSQTHLEISHMIHDAGFRSAIDSELDKEPVLLETFDDKPRDDSAIELQSKGASADGKDWGSSSEEIASSPPDVGEQHDATAEESGKGNQGDSMAVDVDDTGLQLDADYDFVMNGQNSQAGDGSDDGIPLPRNDIMKRHDNRLSTNQTASSLGRERSDAQASHKTQSRTVIQKGSQQGLADAAEVEESFQSATVRANTRSFTEPAILDNGSYDDDDDDDASSQYSDAHSTVPNPFYEWNASAMKKEKAKATNKGPASSQQKISVGISSSNLPKSNQETNKVTGYTTESTKEKITNSKIDLNLSFLNDDREESEDSDADFPDIEVLWASTAQTQKEFSPIKTESEAASQMPKSTGEREAPLPSVRQSSANDLPSNEPEFTVAKDTPVAQQMQPGPNQQQAVGETSSRGNSEEPVNNDNNNSNNDIDDETQSPSFLPDIEFGGSQQDTNVDIDLDNNDSDNQYQHSADNSSHPDFQSQNQQEESQGHSIPMVDLTVSSPLVSPDDSDDEDFAKSHRLPRGPGWVKKNVPGTRRQTRSSTGGRIVLSSSLSPQPARRRRGGRLTQSQY